MPTALVQRECAPRDLAHASARPWRRSRADDGHDDFGRELRDVLDNIGVDTSDVQLDDHHATPTSIMYARALRQGSLEAP